MVVRFYINEALINQPINARAIEIERNFDADDTKQAVSINNFEYGVGDKADPKDGATIIIKHIEDGQLNGVGVGEGLPSFIELDSQEGRVHRIFDGYIDTSKALVRCSKVNAPMVEKNGIDSLEDNIFGVSPEFLKSIGEITSSQYIPCPYVIEKKHLLYY